MPLPVCQPLFMFMSMSMAVVVVMVVVAAAIMIVVMAVVIMAVVMVMVLVGVGVKLLHAHRLLGDLGELEDVVDHLVLEDRRAELCEELGVVAVLVVDLALLARKLPDALKQSAADFVVGDRDLVVRSHLREHEPEPYAPRGDVVIVGFRLLLGRAFVGEAPLGALEVAHHLVPDRLELVVDQGRRQLEAMALIQRVK